MDIEQEIARLLGELADYRMPFGKFGPANFPPRGLPLDELPYEYLEYFSRQGFPTGKLGRLLQFVHAIKRDGAEAIFEPLRQARGQRVSLRRPRRVGCVPPRQPSGPE